MCRRTRSDGEKYNDSVKRQSDGSGERWGKDSVAMDWSESLKNGREGGNFKGVGEWKDEDKLKREFKTKEQRWIGVVLLPGNRPSV